MLCENMQGREEDELLGMAEVFLGKYISSRGGRQYRLCRLFFLKGIITNCFFIHFSAINRIGDEILCA